MKSKRMPQLVLLALIVVCVAAAGFAYTHNSSEIQRQTELTNTLNQKQVTYNKGLAEKDALNKTADDLATQLSGVKALLSRTHFLSSAESIEYDQILYSLADAAKLQITGLNTAPPTDIQELNHTYQLNVFTLNVQGWSPSKLFNLPADDATYNDSVVNNILAFTDSVASSAYFTTAVIPSINLTVPPPMAEADVQRLIDDINTKIAAEIKDDITALTTKIQTENAGALTKAQIDTLIKTATDKLVAQRLAAKSPEQVGTLLDQAGLPRPTAVITINVWTYKGA